ncbi:MAG TPA: hypothetical protein DCE44_16645 [Verrucomicrobiales bacterium]|nr:hypothetical protein [Verrucomicrobiales bacterium]
MLPSQPLEGQPRIPKRFGSKVAKRRMPAARDEPRRKSDDGTTARRYNDEQFSSELATCSDTEINRWKSRNSYAAASNHHKIMNHLKPNGD